MSLRDSVTYVAAVYLIVWVAVLAYMGLIGAKVRRLEVELTRIEAALPGRDDPPATPATPPTPTS